MHVHTNGRQTDDALRCTGVQKYMYVHIQHAMNRTTSSSLFLFSYMHNSAQNQNHQSDRYAIDLDTHRHRCMNNITKSQTHTQTQAHKRFSWNRVCLTLDDVRHLRIAHSRKISFAANLPFAVLPSETQNSARVYLEDTTHTPTKKKHQLRFRLLLLLQKFTPKIRPLAFKTQRWTLENGDHAAECEMGWRKSCVHFRATSHLHCVRINQWTQFVTASRIEDRCEFDACTPMRQSLFFGQMILPPLLFGWWWCVRVYVYAIFEIFDNFVIMLQKTVDFAICAQMHKLCMFRFWWCTFRRNPKKK